MTEFFQDCCPVCGSDDIQIIDSGSTLDGNGDMVSGQRYTCWGLCDVERPEGSSFWVIDETGEIR